jgi:hypothetical protein
MFLEDGTYVSPRRYGELHLLNDDCTNALYKYSVRTPHADVMVVLSSLDQNNVN